MPSGPWQTWHSERPMRYPADGYQSTGPPEATLNVGLPSLSRYFPASDLTAVGSTASSANTVPPEAPRAIVAATSQILRKCFSLSVLMTDQPAREASPRAGTVLIRSLRQREHRQVATERGVIAERCVAADGAETRGRIGQTGR